MKRYVLALIAVAACGDDGGGMVTPDSSTPMPDAPVTCPAVTPPLAAGMHTFYLSFEGVTITKGACDDAKTNCSELVGQASTVVPAFLPAESDRDARIAVIAAEVQTALAQFSVDVVRTRPASGDYWMASIGGTSMAVAGVSGVTAGVKPTCQSVNKSSISLVFDRGATVTDRAYADVITTTFGQLVGLVSVNLSGDCMCNAGSCTHTDACTWGTSVSTQINSCSRQVQNEQELLRTAVGCR
ncbi:MAG TPA: hypothetical protein VMZ53_22885 [Kofleriaceae bacterium]|nr:hypothetical protein [Kofleriaceae bacterium]